MQKFFSTLVPSSLLDKAESLLFAAVSATFRAVEGRNSKYNAFLKGFSFLSEKCSEKLITKD